MRKSVYLAIAVLMAGMLGLLMGCHEDPLSSFQPEIVNNPDNFQFQITGVNGVTTTVSYDWQNSGTKAKANQACSITSGSATLTISDANGTVVYTGDLKNNGDYFTDTGTTGKWLIRVKLVDMRGTINFRVQKVT